MQIPTEAPQQQQQQEEQQQLRFAWRTCGSLATSMEDESSSGGSSGSGQLGRWQHEANYSECKLANSSNNNLFDPTDELVVLNGTQDSPQNDRELFTDLQEQLERIEPSIDPYSDPDLLEQWTLCIGEVIQRQQNSQKGTNEGSLRRHSVQNNNQNNNSTGYCPIIFDGWRCWPTTEAGEIAYVNCPKNQPGFSAERKAYKICTRQADWYRHPATNRYWSNYTTCVDTVDLALGCRLWHILLHYFLVSNYFWMFCEGLYLHTLLVVTFISEDKILKWFYLLGWLTPLPVIILYAYNRSYDENYTNFCWMEESPHNVFLSAPIGISLLLNLIFLINIVRVLVTKLRANNSPDTHQTRKAVRATLILIPLLGLHYMLTPFRPEAKSEWEVYYEIIAAVCTSFQGLCVAMLFCFCNGEVMNAIKKRLKDSIVFNRDNTRTMRSRSNTAISNVFNSVAITNNGNNQNNNHSHKHNNAGMNPAQRRPFADACQSVRIDCVSSSSSGYGNLIANHQNGQRLPLITSDCKQLHQNGQANMASEAGPLQQQHQHKEAPCTEILSAESSRIETEQLMFKILPPTTTTTGTALELIGDETVKLLSSNLMPMSETNNNNLATGADQGGNEAAC